MHRALWGQGRRSRPRLRPFWAGPTAPLYRPCSEMHAGASAACFSRSRGTQARPSDVPINFIKLIKLEHRCILFYVLRLTLVTICKTSSRPVGGCRGKGGYSSWGFLWAPSLQHWRGRGRERAEGGGGQTELPITLERQMEPSGEHFGEEGARGAVCRMETPQVHL